MQPSIDPIEVQKFSALAANWWDETGVYRLLHQLNPLRLQFIQEQLGNVQGLSVLDIGCGGGIVCEPLARQGAQVMGIDASPESIVVANAHAKEMDLSIDYQNITAEELAATGKTFDAVIAFEIIEHVADVASFTKACCALVRPEGKLILSTLNRTMKSFALAIVGAEYLLRWVPRGTHNWQQFLTPAEIAEALRLHDIRVTQVQGLSYSPWQREWQLSTDTDVNYFMVGVRDG